MTVALTLLGIAVVVLATTGVAARLGVLTPLALIAVGIVGSYIPGVPEIALTPDLVLLGLLPPLLYATAIRASVLDIKANKVPIVSLSVGLVLFTTFVVAGVVTLLLPVPFAVAVAIGAVVAPPDAVAATAVARGIGLPRSIVTVLEGESLLNDATALVTLRTAIAATGLAAGHSGFSLGASVADFFRAAIGGALIGLVVFVLVGAIRRRVTDPIGDTALSLVVPFAAFLPAEKVHCSGVIAVVVAGLLLGHRAPVLQAATSRLTERLTWLSIQMVLENAVFLLIGLQAAAVVQAVVDDGLSLPHAFGISLAVLAAALLARPVWIFPFHWVRKALDRRVPFTAGDALVSSWAGMRGVVTLAAVLTLPERTPYRSLLVLVALVVTVGSLVVQGLSLPWLARALGVRGPDPRADALQEAIVMQSAVGAGLRAADADPSIGPDTRHLLHERGTDRVNRVWERLGTGAGSAGEPGLTPSEAWREGRMVALTAEREEILRIRDEGQVDTEVLNDVLATLDVEETALAWSGRRAKALRDSPLLAPAQVAASCEHLAAATDFTPPTTTEGCVDCLADGTEWVHLRACTECGHVGCCDSSVGKHASRHFEATRHPVMRSLEPGEAWRWCFVDDALG